MVGLQLLFLNFNFQISRLSYPRHSVTELYALLVLVPQLPNRCTCTLFLTTREIIPQLNYFISFQGGQMAVCVFIVPEHYIFGRKLIYL